MTRIVKGRTQARVDPRILIINRGGETVEERIPDDIQCDTEITANFFPLGVGVTQ